MRSFVDLDMNVGSSQGSLSGNQNNSNGRHDYATSSNMSMNNPSGNVMLGSSLGGPNQTSNSTFNGK